MPQQTAIEWLKKEIYARGQIGEEIPKWLTDLFEQAKEMEKQQIVDAYEKGWIGRTGEEHYNETHKD